MKSLWGQQTTSARMNSQGVSTIILSLQPTRTIQHQMSITSKTLIKGPDVWTHKDFKHNLDWISHWEDKEIVTKINQDLNAILNKKDIREKLQLQFYDVLTGTPDEFATLIEKDLIRFGKIIKEVNIKP